MVTAGESDFCKKCSTLSCEGKDEAMGFSADFIDHLTATKTNKHDKLLQQIEQWNADDEEQKIIDAILKVPEEERTASKD